MADQKQSVKLRNHLDARLAIEEKLENLRIRAQYTFAVLFFGEETDSTADNVCKVIESLTQILDCKRSQRELLLAEIVTRIDGLNLVPDPNARQNLSEAALLKLRGYSTDEFAEFILECERAIAERRAKRGKVEPRWYDSMHNEISFLRDEYNDHALALDEKLSEWFCEGTFCSEEISLILKMIDDAPWSGVALAQTMQGK